MLAVVLGAFVVFLVFTTVDPPRFDCDPGPRAEERITAYRALTFGIATLVALALGVLACAWSRALRERTGQSPRAGIPTLLAVALPPLLFAIALVDPENLLSLYYFFYGGVVGVAVVPALALAGLVITVAGDRWARPPQRAQRVEAATIAITDGLVFFGLPLAVLLAYLQTLGFCFD